MAEILQFRMPNEHDDLVARVVAENRNASTGGKLQPSAINIMSVSEWNIEHKRDVLLKIWQHNDLYPSVEMDIRSHAEVSGIAEHPSHLLAVTLEIQSPDKTTIQLFGGHYGYVRRSERHQIEQEFDHSFEPGLGLHRLAIDYRLYIACIENVVSGYGEEALVLSYASINSTNERSMNNFVSCGATRSPILPECLRYDDTSGDLVVPGVEFAIFSPQACLEGFYRFKNILEAGHMINKQPVKLRTNQDFADLRFANQIAPHVDQMCALHQRYLAKAHCK